MSVRWRELLLVAIWVALSAQQTQIKPPNYYAIVPPNTPTRDLLDFARRDARIEQVARAICRLRGIDPDHEGPPFPEGPIWELFIPEAMKFLAELDAVTQKGDK